MVRYTLSFVVISVIMIFAGCGKGSDPEPTQAELQTQLLTGESVAININDFWSVTNVSVDGLDYTDEFKDFTIDFDKGSFSSANGTVIFGNSGIWSFKDDSAQVIVLDSGLELTIKELTEKTLVIEFVLDESKYGRLAAVGGRNVFTMNR